MDSDPMQLPELADKIVSQADKWTFEGDCMILKWMEQISNNLETRAKATTESMNKLQKNLNRAQIALENTQNSLIALQYTQYVEMRCQDDETPPPPETIPQQQFQKSPDDVLKTFLQNNLKMLHNCHDKFIFLEDSDEEDNAAATENCIYQPRNPYNERQLPHIFGTKMWKENWHVGLCDDIAMDYSGDEVSEVYSISSASSDANGSLESHNTASLSQWTSSASLNNEFPQKPTSAITTSSTVAPQLPIVPSVKLPATNLMPAKPTHVPSESSIEVSNEIDSSNIGENTKTVIIEEPIEEAKEPEMASSSKRKALQCKTLNLFDDNDFNSLMSQIVDKANTKTNQHTESPSKTPNTANVVTQSEVRKGARLDLFTEGTISGIPDLKVVPPISKHGMEKKISQPSPAKLTKIETEKVKETPKAKTVNLFDSPSPTEDTASKGKSKFDFFKALDKDVVDRSETAKVDSIIPTATPTHEVRTKLSAKSLFDDDDDGDEDFLSLFGKRKSNTTAASRKESIPKDFTINKESTKLMLNEASLFDEHEVKQVTNKDVRAVNVTSSNDIVVEKVEKKVETPAKQIQKPQTSKPLFFEDDNDDELFSKKLTIPVKETEKSLPVYLTTEPPEDIEQNLKKKENSIDADNEYDSDDEWFNTLVKSKSKPKAEDESKKTFEKPAEITTIDTVNVPESSPPLESNDSTEAIKAEPQILAVEIDEEATPNSNEAEIISSKLKNLNNEVVNAEVTEVKAVNHTTKVNNTINESEALNNENDSRETLMEKPVEAAADNTIKQQTSEIETSQSESLEVFPSNIVHATSMSAEKSIGSPQFDSYAALFLDEPPDDDFFQTMGSIPQPNIENDFFEPPAFNQNDLPTDAKADDSNRSSLGYNIGLFSDLPPEDEGEHEVAVETTSARISPTLDELKSTSPPMSSGFVNDLPPTIDNQEKDTPTNNATVNKVEVERETNVAVVPQKTATPTEITSAHNKNTKTNTVSKLKMPKININVQALLPNAGGRPNFRSNLDDEPQSSNETNVPIISAMPTPQPIVPVRNESAAEEPKRAELLPNLCKNRVRVPVKRKSSTRAARQESYHKSLMLAQAEEERQDEIVDKKVIRQEQENVVNIKKIETKTESLIPAKQINPTQSKYIPKSETKTKIESITQENVVPPKQFNPTQFKDMAKSETKTKNVSKIFNESEDENSDDDFFSKLAKPRNIASTSAIGTTNQSQRQNETKTKAVEDSDDDLFVSETVTTTKSAPQLTQVVNNTQNATKANAVVHKELNALFADSNEDDDDDDLFAALSKPKTTFPPTNKAPTLPAHVAKNVTTKPKDSNKSLFSDSEDDDDDLFGPKNVVAVKSAAKSAPQAMTKTTGRQSKVTTTKTTATTQVKAPITKSADNPLADLLGP